MKSSNFMTIPILSLLLVMLSCSQEDSFDSLNGTIPKSSGIETASASDTIKTPPNLANYFPFSISENNNPFLITVEIESPQLFPKYATFFEKYQYSGNGYCWEGHIKQILETLKPELLQHIRFDPEAGAFFATADTKENQILFVTLLSPIFSDLKKLEEYVKKADHSRIDD